MGCLKLRENWTKKENFWHLWWWWWWWWSTHLSVNQNHVVLTKNNNKGIIIFRIYVITNLLPLTWCEWQTANVKGKKWFNDASVCLSLSSVKCQSKKKTIKKKFSFGKLIFCCWNENESQTTDLFSDVEGHHTTDR